MSGGLLAIVFFISFFIFLFIGVPITFSLGASGTLALIVSGAQLSLVIKSMFSPFESFTLLAIFLFTMMGVIYSKSGLASLLVDALMPIIGRVRGGLALVVVYGSALFGALTGSANATCATFSQLLGGEMKRKGYPGDFSAAVIASASPLGQLIPPSITCIVLGVATSTSISTLFMVDLAIGLMTLLFLTVVIVFISSRNKYGESVDKYELKEALLNIAKAAPLLLVPIVVLGGMYGGFFTATEAGAIGSLLSFIMALCYKKLTFKRFYEIIIDSAGTTAMVLFLIATSYIVSYVMSFSGITQWFIDFLVGISANGAMVGMLFLLLIMLIMGCFIDLIVLVIVLAPTAAAALTPLGVNIYQLGAVFLVSNLIAIITPPVGVALFTATSILGEKIENVSKRIVPFIVMYIIITVIIIFFPGTVLWLPRLLGMNVG